MIPSLQPSRPRVPIQSNPRPMNQQPTRNLSSLSTPTPSYSPPLPRNQIEAMPPNPLQAQQPQPQTQPQTPQTRSELDSSKRHPVFFTDRLKKAPMGVNAGGGSWISPVAKGYVFNDGARKSEGGVKL